MDDNNMNNVNNSSFSEGTANNTNQESQPANVFSSQGPAEYFYNPNQNNAYGTNPNYGPNAAPEVVPGKGAAIASMVLGIISICAWFFGIGAVVSLITGVIGLICASESKKAGYTGAMRTAGFVCSIIGLSVGALIVLAVVSCLANVAAWY